MKTGWPYYYSKAIDMHYQLIMFVESLTIGNGIKCIFVRQSTWSSRNLVTGLL